MTHNENSSTMPYKTVFNVDTQTVPDAGKLTSTLLNMPEIGRVAIDLAIMPHEITLYSDERLSVEKIQDAIVADGFEAMYKIGKE